MKRRDFLKNAVALGAGAALLPSCGKYGYELITGEADDAPGDEDFTFVHFADQHVQKERAGDEGYRKCVRQIKALRPAPRFVVMGGDMVFDGNYHTKEKYLRDIDLYKSISDEMGLPYFHCMGNHDTLGLSARRKVPADDPGVGKKLIQDKLGWPSTHYSFNYENWHFVVLDCINVIDHSEHGPIYVPEIDEEQMKWLAADLGRAHGRPIVAFIHIPAVNPKSEIIINNAEALRRLLERHDVTALVQGHVHYNESYRFNGVWYVTGAAVSAAWWSGNWTGNKPTYTVFRCKGDALTWEHASFEWEPRLEPGDDLERKKNIERAEFLSEQRSLAKTEIRMGAALGPRPLPQQKFALK